MKHVAGNMRSRWTDFLTSDGEKPDRNRDSEFELEPRNTREQVLKLWEDGWALVLSTVQAAAAGGSAANRDRSGRGAHGAGSHQSAVDPLRGPRRADRSAQQALRGRSLAVAQYSTWTITRPGRLQERLDLRSGEARRLRRSILLSGPVQKKRQGQRDRVLASGHHQEPSVGHDRVPMPWKRLQGAARNNAGEQRHRCPGRDRSFAQPELNRCLHDPVVESDVEECLAIMRHRAWAPPPVETSALPAAFWPAAVNGCT